MVMAPQKIDGGEYVTVAEAVDQIGCTEGWVRMLLRDGKLRGRRFGSRIWLIPVEACREARDALSTRANSKKHLAKRPAAGRKKAKRKK
jgi:excisionase family DNA binding protein